MEEITDIVKEIVNGALVNSCIAQFKAKHSEEYKKRVGVILDEFNLYSRYFYPSSRTLEENYEAIRMRLCEEAGRAYHATGFNEGYTRFKLNEKNRYLMPDATNDPCLSYMKKKMCRNN